MQDISHITLGFVFQMIAFIAYTVYFIFICKRKKIKDKDKIYYISVATAVFLFVILFGLK